MNDWNNSWDRWDSGRQTPWEEPPRRRTPRRSSVVIFLLFLAAIAVGVGLLIRGRARPEPVLPPVTATSELENSLTIQSEEYLGRAETGTGVTLPLFSREGLEPLSYQEIYQKNIPSVVYVRSSLVGGVSSGTGVVMQSDGYIITNAHVVEGATDVTVTLEDGRSFGALLVGQDAPTDLAVLKIDAAGLTPAEFGSSEELQVGDEVLAIGNPLGEELRGTMTNGIISGINRDVTVEGHDMTLLQTTAALNTGNSGGPLINLYGQVVGINNMKMMSDYSTIEGLGFSIPAATVKTVVDELIERGYVAGRPALGITCRAVGAGAALFYDQPPGVRVESVNPLSDAWNQGLREGDVILEAEGQPVSDPDELNAAKESLGVGDVLHLTVSRDGEILEFSIELMDQSLLQ